MDREKEELVYEIPEAEILDYWEEGSEYIIYRIKDLEIFKKSSF